MGSTLLVLERAAITWYLNNHFIVISITMICMMVWWCTNNEEFQPKILESVVFAYRLLQKINCKHHKHYARSANEART